MKFSLIFFSGDERNKYRLVMEVAKFADEKGFEAIWVPERHFHRFGGLYPNPSVLAAALSMVTKRLKIRAGSVILPTHSPIRVAEEWAMVDNLSGGRVGIGLATGFSPIDFVFRPENWNQRRAITFEAVDQIRQLWEGDSIVAKDGVGNHSRVELHPRPIQEELPIWLTCTKSVQTFEQAGELGCNVLTGLIDMSTEELETKLQAYYGKLDEAGHDRSERTVTLMLHAFVGQDEETVRGIVREPFLNYLQSFFKVIDTQKKAVDPKSSVENFSAADKETLLSFGFDKFFNKGSLMGTPEKCLTVIRRMQGLGVDEIACLIDFGVDEDEILRSLGYLAELKDMVHRA